MSLNRTAKQRDRSEPGIVEHFRACGWKVVRHQLWDLDICCPQCKAVIPIECKTPPMVPSQVTHSQLELVEEGWPLRFVSTPQEAEAVVKDHQRNCLRRQTG